MDRQSLERQAASQLNAGKYKDAIELYKKLLRGADSSDWQRQLAFCYLQRAKAFALKAMFKEALVMWENYREHAQPPYENYDHYLIWLIQSRNLAKIQIALKQLTVQQLDKDYPELAAVLGLLILTEHPEFEQALPQDSAFIAHLKIVKTALQAYRDNDLDGMDSALKQLPYRSAFRDFRTLLKAGIALSNSPADTTSLLGKIPANSPYLRAARLLLACTLKGAALAHEILKLSPPQRRLIGEIIGLNKQQFELVESLSRQKEPFADKLKFNLALQFQSLFGPESAQRFCFAALATYPAGRRDCEKAFGAIDEFEANRLKALACEGENNDYDAEYYWKQAVRALTQKGAGNDLRIALILRHIAQKQPAPEQISLLIESLEHDPDDKDCYLQILQHYGQHPETTDSYKEWLAKSIDKFPQDIEVLTLAVQAATRSKAYKKAIQYALKIVQIDPLNTFAKQVIFSSHIAHARRLLKTKKHHLVESEIEQAEALKLGKNYSQQIHLMRALLCFAAGDKQQGLTAIAEVLNKLNADPVNACFQGTIEAQLTGLPVATLLRELPPAREQLLSAAELTRLIRLITQYSQEDGNQELLHKALDKIKAPLKQSVLKQHYDENLLLTLCQTLDTIKHFELLRHCAKWAQARWHKPIWVYYQVYAETNGKPEEISYIHRLRLMANLDKAREDNDQRARMLIEQYLDRYHEAHTPVGLDFLGDLFGSNEPDDSIDFIGQLFGHLPEEVFRKIDQKADALVKKTSPERLVQELNKIGGNNSNLLLAMMKEPDLFAALMIVKAANELGMDIGVAFKDVLECFAVDKAPKSFPFPF